MDITSLTLKELSDKLHAKEISSPELTCAYLDKIKALDGKLESYITVTEEIALAAANTAQEKLNAGNASPLCGIPLAIKDNICTEGVKTTCASKMLESFVPPYDAAVMEKLHSQNIVMLGKTSMDEFAMGASTQTSAFKKTKNPYDLEKVPGGSSGGSASAVGAGLCAVALGSDTGGSIRQPAAFCGVTGLKPTYGRVSRYGLVAFASSLDCIGAIARTAADCGIILNAIAGSDDRDPTSSKRPTVDFTSKLGINMKGVRIALPIELYSDSIDKNVRKAVLSAADTYKAMGAELSECSMPSLKYAVAAYYLISSAEASSNLSRFDGIKYGHRSENAGSFEELVTASRTEGFGEEVKRRILLGNYALSSGYYDDYYLKAMAVKHKIAEEYAEIFTKCDCILTPTAPTTAFNVTDDISDPKKMYSADICTAPVNLAALPAISLTCGYDPCGMPIGMSLVGRMWDEAFIIGAADAFESTFTPVAAKI